MTSQTWQKMSKEQKEKWQKLTSRVEAQNMIAQEDYEDLTEGIFSFEKIIPNKRFKGT